jgi:hypothetical protein
MCFVWFSQQTSIYLNSINLPLFWKNRSRLMRLTCRTPDPIFIKFGMYIMAPEPIPTAYFINRSHQSVCRCISLLGNDSVKKNATAATNTHATIEELLDASFSMRSVSYQKEVSKCWDGSQVPSWYCMLLMQPSPLKFIKIKLLCWQSH